jgi:hypothetical protein
LSGAPVGSHKQNPAKTAIALSAKLADKPDKSAPKKNWLVNLKNCVILPLFRQI